MNSPENYSANRPGPAPLKLTVPAECAGLRLDQALSRLLPEYSRSRLAQWVRAGRATLDGRAVLPRQKVRGGEIIDIVPSPDPATLAQSAENIPLDIVYEDGALLVVNKPAGLVVHPGSGNWSGTLLNALLQHAPALANIPRAGIVHRLDQDTSGLLVVAKTLPAQTDLVRQLQARSVRREYLAVVHGRVARDGKIEVPIGRHPVKRTRMAALARGRHAVTHYEVIERYLNATLLRCRLETGRTHQIRVHLSSLGHPLIGDATYGKRNAALAFPRQALHAERLALLHPQTRRTMNWRVAPPADMRRLIASLRAQAVK
ncbi:MAG: 23S rRNA pseudouridine(1911/1915/1917) synthase RluD [Betaproteobacteria bacterium]|nr:23S rRNA pseudouridine(1911/1915/1917) synthase RluD [Betaproteobacteria bacterium]